MTRNPEKLGCKCKECPLRGATPIFPRNTTPTSRKKLKLIVVGEAPGYEEELEGKYFVGESGRFLDRMLAYLGIPSGKLYITNACLCRGKNNMSPGDWKKAIACCQPRLAAEVKGMPRRLHIVSFGGRALQSLVGRNKIFDWAGAPLPVDPMFGKRQVLPTLHPAFVLRPNGNPYVPTLLIHLQRAWDMAHGRLPEWKWPKIIIHPGKEMYSELQRMYREKLPVGFDVETQGTNPLSATCMCLALANSRRAVSMPFESYTAGRFGLQKPLDSYPYGRRIRALVVKILADPKIPKVFQNGPHDILTARRAGISINNYDFDTLLAHALVSMGTKHDLGFICCQEFHAPRWKEERHTASNEKGADKFAKRDPEELRLYNAKDAYMTVLLREPLGRRLDKLNNGWRLFRENYMANVKVVIEMQARGVKVDQDRKKAHRRKLYPRMKDAERLLKQLSMRLGIKDYNPRSPVSNNKLFFERLRVSPRFYTDKGAPSLKEEMLTDLVSHPNAMVCAAARALLRYRKWHKLISTYIDGLPADKKNIVHATFNVHGARTFRWSSSEPNMQNIPKPAFKRLKNGKTKVVAPGMRDMFVPRPGMWFVAADYSQLEMRIMAQLSGDELLIEAYKKGLDVHTQNSKDLFRVENAADKMYRNMAKVAGYQMNYYGTPEALWKTLLVDFPNVTLKDCILMHKRWFERHHWIKAFQDKMIATAEEHRRIKAPISGHEMIFYGRIDPAAACNYPIQHSAADIINPTVSKVARRLKWPKEGIIAQVHDELLVEGPNPVRLAKILIEEMTQTITVEGVEMEYPVDIKVSRSSWGECEEMSLEKLQSLYRSSSRKRNTT